MVERDSVKREEGKGWRWRRERDREACSCCHEQQWHILVSKEVSKKDSESAPLCAALGTTLVLCNNCAVV